MAQSLQHSLIIDGLALANSGFASREIATSALENYFDLLERELPLILALAKPTDPPPPNWRSVWRAYSR